MMLYQALDVVMPRFRTIFREFGLTEQQWRILRALWDRDDLSARQLADMTLIPPPSYDLNSTTEFGRYRQSARRAGPRHSQTQQQ